MTVSWKSLLWTRVPRFKSFTYCINALAPPGFSTTSHDAKSFSFLLRLAVDFYRLGGVGLQITIVRHWMVLLLHTCASYFVLLLLLCTSRYKSVTVVYEPGRTRHIKHTSTKNVDISYMPGICMQLCLPCAHLMPGGAISHNPQTWRNANHL